MDLLYLISLADTKDPEILRTEREDDCINIFEAYANGGFNTLSAWMREKPDDEVGDQAILQALSKMNLIEQTTGNDADVQFG
jgi:hypothetical protein